MEDMHNRRLLNLLYGHILGVPIDLDIVDEIKQKYVHNKESVSFYVDYKYDCYLTRGDLIWDFYSFHPDDSDCIFYTNQVFEKKDSEWVLKKGNPFYCIISNSVIVRLKYRNEKWTIASNSQQPDGMLVCRDKYIQQLKSRTLEKTHDLAYDFLDALNNEIEMLNSVSLNIDMCDIKIKEVADGKKELKEVLKELEISNKDFCILDGPLSVRLFSVFVTSLPCFVVLKEDKSLL